MKKLISMAALAWALPMAANAAPAEPLTCQLTTIQKGDDAPRDVHGIGSILELFDNGATLFVRSDGLNPAMEFTVTHRSATITVAQMRDFPASHLTLVVPTHELKVTVAPPGKAEVHLTADNCQRSFR